MRSRYLTILLIALAMSISAGCSKNDNPTLAKVGDFEIKFDDYYQRYGNWRLNPVSAEDEFNKKKDLLDSMVILRILINAAYEKNIDKLEELSRTILANRNRFLLDALYKEKIARESEPSDAEVKEFYNRLEFQVRASHILVETLDTANMILEKLKNGENFEKLAYDYSIDPSAKRNRGDLGYFLWGAMIEEFQIQAFSMQPGEISPPVKTDYGYHIIKVVDRTPNDLRQDFDKMKDSLAVQLKGINVRRKLAEFLEDIKTRYNVKIDSGTCEYLMYKRSELYPPELLAQIPKNDFDLETLDRNEKELVLATWDGGQISLLEYFSLARRLPANARPNFDDYAGLTEFIFRLKTEEILALEATKIGLDQNNYFKMQFKRFKEQTMAEIMKLDSIPQLPPPTEEDARVYFETNPKEFTQPMKIHVFEIQLSDEIKANEIKKQIKSLTQFKEKAMDLTERPGKRSVGGDLQYIEHQWYPEIFDLAQKTSAGNLAGPVLSRGKYSLIWVSDKLPEQIKDFLSVKNEILTKLDQEVKSESFRRWVGDQKEKNKIEYYDKEIWNMIDKNAYAAVDTAKAGG